MIGKAQFSRKEFLRISALGSGVIAAGPLMAATEKHPAPFDTIIIKSLAAIPIAGTVIVEIVGDNGERGYGEPSAMKSRTTLCSMINDNIAPLLIGEIANHVERLWDRMFTMLYKIGPQGHLNLAMSGVDIALFDLLGKSFGLPVYQLLGGKFRDSVKVYASSLRREDSPQVNAERAVRFMEAGYEHTKLKLGVRWGRNAKPLYDEYETVKVVCEAIGPGKLAIDANGAYTSQHALKLAERLREFNILFFEEPVPPYDLQGLAEVARRSSIPVATGESAQSKYQFRDLITHKSAHILQPDVQKCGGLLEAKKIAALAETWNLPIIVHSTKVPMGTLATLHFAAGTPMCFSPQEFSCGDPPRREIRNREGIEVMVRTPLVDSSFAPPDVPGMGYRIDAKWLQSKRED